MESAALGGALAKVPCRSARERLHRERPGGLLTGLLIGHWRHSAVQFIVATSSGDHSAINLERLLTRFSVACSATTRRPRSACDASYVCRTASASKAAGLPPTTYSGHRFTAL